MPQSVLMYLYSVDALYDVIQGAVDRDAAVVTVSYDNALHYPTSIQIDYIINAADDELSVTASGLRTGS